MEDPSRARRFLAHKWWAGISGIFAVLAVVVAIALEGGPAPGEAPAPTAPAAGDVRVEDGDCNAQGRDISITCVEPAPVPTAEGLEFFRQTSEPLDETVSELVSAGGGAARGSAADGGPALEERCRARDRIAGRLDAVDAPDATARHRPRDRRPGRGTGDPAALGHLGPGRKPGAR